MKHMKWSDQEVSILSDKWPTATKDEMAAIFSYRSYASVNLKASNLGLRKCYEGKHPNVQADLSILLNDELETFYWIGFLTGDGSFSKNRLKLSLAIKDGHHVAEFSKYIKCKNFRPVRENTAVQVSVQDKFYVPKITSKFNLQPVKTYNPPLGEKMPLQSNDAFISYFVGLIDADGNIQHQSGRTDCSVRLKLHSSWLKFLRFTVDRLCGILDVRVRAKPRINSRGYAEWSCADSRLVTSLKKYAILLSIPLLHRKWSKIDEHFVSRYVKAAENRIKVGELIKKGLRNKEISRLLGLSPSTISNINRRMNSEY